MHVGEGYGDMAIIGPSGVSAAVEAGVPFTVVAQPERPPQTPTADERARYFEGHPSAVAAATAMGEVVTVETVHDVTAAFHAAQPGGGRLFGQ